MQARRFVIYNHIRLATIDCLGNNYIPNLPIEIKVIFYLFSNL